MTLLRSLRTPYPVLRSRAILQYWFQRWRSSIPCGSIHIQFIIWHIINQVIQIRISQTIHPRSFRTPSQQVILNLPWTHLLMRSLPVSLTFHPVITNPTRQKDHLLYLRLTHLLNRIVLTMKRNLLLRHHAPVQTHPNLHYHRLLFGIVLSPPNPHTVNQVMNPIWFRWVSGNFRIPSFTLHLWLPRNSRLWYKPLTHPGGNENTLREVVVACDTHVNVHVLRTRVVCTGNGTQR